MVEVQTGKGVDGMEDFHRGLVGFRLREPPFSTENTPDTGCTVMFSIAKLDAVIEALQLVKQDAIRDEARWREGV